MAGACSGSRLRLAGIARGTPSAPKPRAGKGGRNRAHKTSGRSRGERSPPASGCGRFRHRLPPRLRAAKVVQRSQHQYGIERACRQTVQPRRRLPVHLPAMDSPRPAARKRASTERSAAAPTHPPAAAGSPSAPGIPNSPRRLRQSPPPRHSPAPAAPASAARWRAPPGSAPCQPRQFGFEDGGVVVAGYALFVGFVRHR